MASWISPLLPLFEAERAGGAAAALAVVLRTAGSTYRKAGALMLITREGRYAGLISGGCLESDLAEHARGVIDSGVPRQVSYDLRNPEEVIWGLGVGCEGAMDVLLIRIGALNGWQPLAGFAAALQAHRPAVAAVVVESAESALPAGTVVTSAAAAPAAAVRPDGTPAAVSPALAQLLDDTRRAGTPQQLQAPGLEVFATPLALPPRLLLLGAGPDTLPLVAFAVRLGWKVTLNDHRPAYADPQRFPGAARVLCVRPQQLPAALSLDEFEAAVVMSHHLPSDLEYLRALAASTLPYVGLLGPAARRERLLADLGETAAALRGRLRAPVGLALGGRTPESIALAIVAEIHASLHGEGGGPFQGETGALREEPGAAR